MESSNVFDFTKFFTSDGSELMTNYINSLKSYMIKEGVGSQQIDVIINGIYEFIQEFSSNYNEDKINFSSTLNLIDEIGSPTEIIQSIDYKRNVSEINTITCPYCSLENASENKFCEFCGKKLNNTNIHTQSDNQEEYYPYKHFIPTRRQDIIDHPYSRSYIISTLFFTVIFMLFRLFSFPSVFSFTGGSWVASDSFGILGFFVVNLVFSIVFALGISIYFSLLFGAFIDLVYKDQKSAKFKYKAILDHFEQNVAGGALMVFFGTTFLTFFASLKSELIPVMIIFWFAVTLTNLIYLIYFGRQSFRPNSFSLTQLNLLKYNIEKINKGKYRSFNKSAMLPVILVSIISSLIINPAITIGPLIFGVSLFSIVYLLILNGFLTMQLNSWKNLINYPIKQEI